MRASGDVHAGVDVLAFPSRDPLIDGLADLVAGRLPTRGGEVALAPHLAGELGVGVGDRLVIERPSRLSLAVVGLVEQPGRLGAPLALTVPGGALLDADPRHPPTTTAYVDLPDAASLDRLRGRPGVLVRGDFVEDASGMSGLLVIWIYLIGAVVLTVTGIVIAAAFAAGARRQLVLLGQLSANGAPGRLLRTTLVLQGTVTGLVGAVAGVALVLGLLIANRTSVEEMVRFRFDRYDIRPADLAGAVIVGVIAASVAALIPAWSITRISTLAALAGRRPLRPVRRRVTAGGLAAVAAGLGLMALAVLGSPDRRRPGRVGLRRRARRRAGAAGRLRGGPRGRRPARTPGRPQPRCLAPGARGLARERARTGAVVSAVAAAGGLAVATTALLVGYEAGEAARPQPPDRVVLATRSRSTRRPTRSPASTPRRTPPPGPNWGASCPRPSG